MTEQVKRVREVRKSASKVGEVVKVPVALIKAGSNDRKAFDAGKLKELADSIAAHGLAQPITLRYVEGGYEIVAGERRFRAIAEVLRWGHVPAIVRELSDEEASAIMLVENTSRVDLDPIAEAEAYSVRQERFGWEMAKIAETAGVSVERVRSRLALLGLVDEVKHFVRTGAFPIGHAQALGVLDSNRQRVALKVWSAAKHMPLSRFQEIVTQLHAQQTAESQMSLFDMELVLMQQVESDGYALRGKKARTGAPTRKDLPKPRTRRKAEPMGDMLERYIVDLLQGGFEAEAAVIGNVYNALVAGNWMNVPANSTLLKMAEDASALGDDTYVLID